MSFAGLLRQLRTRAGLTQEELAEAASVSARSVSDLERGINLTARKETARLLADALGLAGPARALFEAAARGHVPAADALLDAGDPGFARAGITLAPVAAVHALPRDTASFTGRVPELERLMRELKLRRAPQASWTFMPLTGWPGSARPRSRCTPLICWPRVSRTGSFSCRCTHTPLGSILLIRGRRLGPCCWPLVSPPVRSLTGWTRGQCCGAMASRAKRSCWSSMMRPAMSRSGRCCPVLPAAWC